MGMDVPVLIIINATSVIEPAGAYSPGGVELGISISRHGHSKVPKLHALVLAVTEDISTVALTVDVSQTLNVTDESASFSVITHASSIPNLDRRIVGT
jgi:hypothetical protein